MKVQSLVILLLPSLASAHSLRALGEEPEFHCGIPEPDEETTRSFERVVRQRKIKQSEERRKLEQGKAFSAEVPTFYHVIQKDERLVLLATQA